MLSEFTDDDPCAGLDFHKSKCGTKLEKCFEKKFSAEMEEFFVERAIQFKQWMIFAKKLLDIHHAKSVFYFFSPFLLQFCLMNELKWYHIFYEECLHVNRWKWTFNIKEFYVSMPYIFFLREGLKKSMEISIGGGG